MPQDKKRPAPRDASQPPTAGRSPKKRRCTADQKRVIDRSRPSAKRASTESTRLSTSTVASRRANGNRSQARPVDPHGRVRGASVRQDRRAGRGGRARCRTRSGAGPSRHDRAAALPRRSTRPAHARRCDGVPSAVTSQHVAFHAREDRPGGHGRVRRRAGALRRAAGSTT